ncbi:MAG: hypothetical protein IPI19_16780 [Ignavibacteriales bacterium]|nr:hypothetical protein [Ignavibacteriales bacterium]
MIISIPNTEFEYGDINNDGKEDIIVLLNICEGFESLHLNGISLLYLLIHQILINLQMNIL